MSWVFNCPFCKCNKPTIVNNVIKTAAELDCDQCKADKKATCLYIVGEEEYKAHLFLEHGVCE